MDQQMTEEQIRAIGKMSRNELQVYCEGLDIPRLELLRDSLAECEFYHHAALVRDHVTSLKVLRQ